MDQPDAVEIRFAVDTHLGKLARLLRILGFDAVYHPKWRPEDFVELSRLEQRIVLTRDRHLLARKSLERGWNVPSQEPYEQLAAVVEHFDLRSQFRPFSRCSCCNTELKGSPDGQGRRTCLGCGRTYWQGSHTRRMCEFIAKLKEGCSHAGG
jgi:uncharacterized protein